MQRWAFLNSVLESVGDAGSMIGALARDLYNISRHGGGAIYRMSSR